MNALSKPKPPMFNGNPPPYSPMGDMAARCATAEFERDQLREELAKVERGLQASQEANRALMEQVKRLEEEVSVYDHANVTLKAQLDAAKRREAKMREALFDADLSLAGGCNIGTARAKLKATLSPDAGEK